MIDSPSLPLPQTLAGALRRLAQLSHTSSWNQWATQRLTPTQRRILELLALHRKEELTLSAVARELGVTPATASDSVAALEAKGLVLKQRSQQDGRALALLLTEQGQLSVMKLAALPDPLQTACATLSEQEQAGFYRVVFKMIHGLQESGALPPSRMCVRCKFFDSPQHPDSAKPYYCNAKKIALADHELFIDCPEHEVGDKEVPHAIRACSNERRTDESEKAISLSEHANRATASP